MELKQKFEAYQILCAMWNDVQCGYKLNDEEKQAAKRCEEFLSKCGEPWATNAKQTLDDLL